MDDTSWNTVQKTVQIQNWTEEAKNRFIAQSKQQEEDLTEGEYLRGLFQSGLNQYAEGNYQAASELFVFLRDLLILGLKPDLMDPIPHSEVYFALATSLQALRNYKGAHYHYVLSYLYDQCNPTPIFWASECLIALGDIGKAKEALELVIFTGKERPEFSEFVEKAKARHAQLSSSGVDVE